MVWIPHSVLADPAQRPARSSSEASTAELNGQHPMLGYPWIIRDLVLKNVIPHAFAIPESHGIDFSDPPIAQRRER